MNVAAGQVWVLENSALRVEFDVGSPIVLAYEHKKSSTKISGAYRHGCLAINGQRFPWSKWQVNARLNETKQDLCYELFLDDLQLGMEFGYHLENDGLVFEIKKISEGATALHSIEWHELPLVRSGGDFRYWREEWSQQPWDSKYGRGLYRRRQGGGRIKYALPEESSQDGMHACCYDGAICFFVGSNYPSFPLRTQLRESARFPGRCAAFTVSPGRYQYRIRDRRAELLRMKVVFLEDINNDGCADECDYKLWLNRGFPEPNPLYRDRIWYKIFCARPGEVVTTFSQALEIIEAVHNITGGIGQIVYLVGWQYDGHDTGYPSLEKINPGLGSREELLDLWGRAKQEFNCIVSYHINVDDAYREHPSWDDSIICRDVDGGIMPWEVFNNKTAYHICHTKDVESGKIFSRLKAMLDLVPVAQTIHLDAFRCTNCSWEKDGFIGVMEELECGVKPIIKYFNDRGIDVSTESVDMLGIEPAGLFSGIWHMWLPQIYHGKILGGGRGRGSESWGVGGSFNSDINYPSFRRDWRYYVDQIYLGAMLYRYYLQKEMTIYREDPDKKRIFIKFDDDCNVDIDSSNEQLKVTHGDTVVAEGSDRFLPFADAIYAYSESGGERTWQLPAAWQDVALEAHNLSADGRHTSVALGINGGDVTLTMTAQTPVKIVRG
ncbi:endo-alpha-N-acetylgalactosaminidase family protein [Planctomycetota bacterium]